MKRLCRVVPLIFLILLTLSTVSYSAWIWTPETNKWINPKRAVKDTSNEQLQWGLSFYEAKDYKRAITEFNKLVQFYPNSKDAPKAQYYVGRCYGDMEEYYHAYLAYQKVIETYPYAGNREEIIKRQYDIGLLFFGGQKAKIVGVALLPAIDKAIEIFNQVVKNSPYGEYADKAQFKAGEAYKKSNRFAEATLAFQKLLDEYPKSDLANEANYQIAHCAYLASLGYSYDQETTDVAIDRFEEFVGAADGSSLSKEAKESISILKEKKAKGLYDTAHFYEKIGRRNSAAIYYKELVDKYPTSSLAKDALVRFMEIEKSSTQR